MEGVAFNHRTHVDALRDEFEMSEGRLTGGAVKSGRGAQMFADALGITVLLTDAEESGSLGAAMCAAVGAGMHDSLEAATAASLRVTGRLDEKYGHYRRVIEALEGAWEASGGEG